MIKTANLTGSLSRNAGGLYESVRRLVHSLLLEGVDVRVMGARDEFTAADLAAWQPATVAAFKSSWPEFFGYSPDYLREMLAYHPDLTHTHGIWRYTSVATANYSRATRTPYIISPHGMIDPWALRNARWKKVIAHALYEGANLRGAACLRALCESEAQAMRLAGLKNPICVIPNGIDLPLAVESSGLRVESRGQGGGQRSEVRGRRTEDRGQRAEGGGRKTLLYLGRIHPKKGLANLLRAWKLTLNAQPSTLNSWVLAIAGWDQGGHEAELKRLCDELGIAWSDDRQPSTLNPQPSASVVFLGPQFNEGKAVCYQDCDAFILPSFSEGLPMVVLEAWAYGKPVLMTPECNLPDGFANGAAIRIATDVASIATGLQTLAAMTPAQREQMGRLGRRLAAEKYSWSAIAKELKAVYEWMLGGGPPPGSLYPS